VNNRPNSLDEYRHYELQRYEKEGFFELWRHPRLRH
jgi:hypothetical protein